MGEEGAGKNRGNLTASRVFLRIMAKPDIDLLVKQLRARGHEVKYVHAVPDNAGEFEFTIDGDYLNLEEARQLLERDAQR